MRTSNQRDIKFIGKSNKKRIDVNTFLHTTAVSWQHIKLKQVQNLIDTHGFIAIARNQCKGKHMATLFHRLKEHVRARIYLLTKHGLQYMFP